MLITTIEILNILHVRGVCQNSYELSIGSCGVEAISSGKVIEMQDVNHLSEKSKTDSVILPKETGDVSKLSWKTISGLGCDLGCNTCVAI
jgi:hypothetical protein